MTVSQKSELFYRRSYKLYRQQLWLQHQVEFRCRTDVQDKDVQTNGFAGVYLALMKTHAVVWFGTGNACTALTPGPASLGQAGSVENFFAGADLCSA